MSNAAPVGKRSIIYVFASTLQKLTSLLLLPVYTRLLTPEDYGYFNLVVLFVLLASTVSLLGLDFAVMRYCHPEGRSQGQQAKHYSAATGMLIASGLLCVAVLLLSQDLFSPIVFPDLNFYPVVVASLASVIGQPLTVIYMALLQTHSRAKMFGAYTLSLFGVNALLTVVLLGPLQLGVLGASIAISISNIAFGIVGVIGAWRIGFLWKRFGLEHVRELLSYSLPMMPHSVSLQVGALTTRVIVSNILSVSAAGLFNIAMYAVSVIDAVQTALHRAYLPWYFAEASTRRAGWQDRVGTMVASFVAVNVAMSAIVALFSRELLLFLTPEPFQAAAALIPLLALSMMLKAVYYPELSVLLHEQRGTRYVLLISLSSIALSLLLAIALGIIWGMFGILLSQVFQRAWMSGTAVALANRTGAPRLPWGRILRLQLIGLSVIFFVLLGDQASWWQLSIPFVVLFKIVVLAAMGILVVVCEPSIAQYPRKAFRSGNHS